MDLSPNDIRNYEFSTKMRGYDKQDVDSFLDQTANALEALKQENLKLSMELDSVKTQLTGLREFEDTIKSAAIDARRNADMTVANAQKEADLILSEANTEAEKAIGTRTSKINELENKISQLERARKTYLSQLRTLISSHQELLEDIARGDFKKELAESSYTPGSTGGKIEVTDSSEVDRGKMETIVGQAPQASSEDAEEVVDEESATPPSSKTTDTGKIPIQTETKESAPVDPELAAALENYSQPEPPTSITEPNQISTEPPVAGDFVETTTRAEDVPSEFIVNDEQASDPVESSSKEAKSKKAGDQDASGKINMADELDNIAAKFAEEMDKAAKS